MDKLKLQADALRKLREHYEQQLKYISFELCDLPEDVVALLGKCLELQCATQIQDLNLNYLREYYYIKKREAIDRRLIISQKTAALQKLKREIDENEREVAGLERFMGSAQKRASVDTLRRNTLAAEGKIRELEERNKALKIPDDFDVEALIEKVQLLEKGKK
ncbi:augmin complex subunit wac [Scaptodrosophila lebanonensis]|uniref:Augmin complex subunit wac n=1 Tax=Drosophila lebanonensis TaxID=7225 RepID=A0A6J2UD13_DROLE|nr:augmin complex subunit wac [Scaptodrosophila lebanonensis]